MRSGWDPTRRNRNIGTAKSGHGQDNRLVIPNPRNNPNPFWGRLTRYRTVARPLRGRTFSVLVEQTRPGCVHACTPDDIFTMLEHIPDLWGINFLILRQPKRKEVVLRSSWGRLAYRVRVGDHDGAAIILEAIDPGRRLCWPKSLRP